MAAEGIRSTLIYPEPLYLNPIFTEKAAYPKGCPFSCPLYGRKIEYKPGISPVAEKVTKDLIRLPLHPDLPMEDIHDVAAAAKKIIENQQELT